MDTLGNLLTSIRNAELAGHAALEAPHTKQSVALLQILKQNGYISAFETVGETAQQKLAVTLPEPVVRHHYRRISKPGRRLYTNTQTIPTVLRGLGIVILSTSKGVMTGKEAKQRKLGGEIICEVY